MDPITGLAIGRISLGALSFLSPGLAARLFLLDPTANPQLGLMVRLFGPREVALGALTLAAKGEARRQLVGIGLAVDSADAINGVVGAASGKAPKPAALLLAAVAAAAVVTGARELQQD